MQIFEWKSDGVGSAQICRRLNEANIPSPCKYRWMKGILKDARYETSQWHPTSLRVILDNPVYLGHTVQGKQVGALYEGKGRKRAAKDDWIIVENTHPAIVDKEIFEKATQVVNDRKAAYYSVKGKYNHMEKPENILKGLVFCFDCKHPLYLYKSVTRKGKQVDYFFQCRTYTTYLDAACTKKYLNEKELIRVVYVSIKTQIANMIEKRQLIERLNRSTNFKNRISKFDVEINEINTNLKRLSGLRQAIYEDYRDKLLTEQEYRFALLKYDSDIETGKQRLQQVTELKSAFTQNFTSSNKWVAAFERFESAQELTYEMAHALIERIEVKSDNEVCIQFRFMDEYKMICEFVSNRGKVVGL